MEPKLEFLNKVEIRGVVLKVEINTPYDKRVADFTVVTEHTVATKEGYRQIETVIWHVLAFDSPKNQISNLEPNAWVQVTGRLRRDKYVSSTGAELECFRIIASELSVLAVVRAKTRTSRI